MTPMLLDAQHWRTRAQEIRALAQGITDLESKRTMLRIADDYELLAKRADERAASNGAAQST